MICTRCSSENTAAARFCTRCGVQLGESCLACGFENPPESQFCGGCGSRLQELRSEDAQGERRQLTVLFCDLVGSTELARSMDPEDLAELLASYQRVCGDAVAAHEGHIAQYLGDGVVMYFGYPRAHEDEAQRAVRCGLDILAGVRALEDNQQPDAQRLTVRLGAHTGRVVVGPVGAGDRKSRIAVGDTPNLAARIQAAADVGTLAISETTWKIVHGYFDAEPHGEHVLKGVAEPMLLWTVTGEGTSRERVEVAPQLTPFVGRHEEWRLLKAAWESAAAGCSQFVLIQAEPGMGKSRLVQRFREDLKSTTNLLPLRATPYNSASPFFPAIELIADRLGVEPQLGDAERLARLESGLVVRGITDPEAVVLLGSLLSVPTEGSYQRLTLSPARRRARIMHLLVDLVARVAETGPTVLIMEDLHWADPSTLELIQQLVQTVPKVPLLAILTSRPGFDAAWLRSGRVQILELERFDRTDAEAVVRGVASGKALPSEMLRHVVTRCDGVPLFLEEMTRFVLESGVLNERSASWAAVGAVAQDVIPDSVDASLTARIDRLGASRATAQLAAAIGREFTWALLREVSERDDATLQRDLDVLVTSGLAAPTEPHSDAFSFKHALVRDAAYNSLLRSVRQTYHSRIATALLDVFPEQAALRPDLIADHLTRARLFGEAVPFLEAAGRQALERASAHEAADHLRRALHCLEQTRETPERQANELELLILLAPLLMTVYGWGATEVEDACARALDLARELERYDRSYPPMWGLWTVRFLRGEMVPATEAAQAVLNLALASGGPVIEVTGRHATSYTHLYSGRFEQALKEAEAGLALFDPTQEKELASTFALSSSVCLMASRATSCWMVGRPVDANVEWERMIKLGRDLQHPPSLAAALAFALHGGGFRYSYVEEMARLCQTADELIALCHDEDFFMWYAVGYTYRGIVAEAMGDVDRARTQMSEGLELFEQTGSRLTLVFMNVLCADALRRLGDHEQGLARLAVAEQEMQRRAEALFAPEVWRVRGRILAEQGDPAGAAEAYRTAIGCANSQGARALALRAALDRYDLHAADGRSDDDRAAVAEILTGFTQGFEQPELARAAAIVRPASV
jgi:class 3 adenylate cyclase/tetratricopeptide (TPR) repeat protein